MARSTLTTPVSLVLFVASLAVLASRKIESLWVILAAVLQLGAAAFGLVRRA